MNKLLSVLLLLMVCVSCAKNNQHNSIGNNDMEYKIFLDEKLEEAELMIDYSSKVIPEITKYNNFEVAYLDFYKTDLTRIFISIDEINVYDTIVIESIISDIKLLFDIQPKTRISFFSEIKYADYKDILFMNENHLLPKEEYDNWMDFYYLAEYEFETQEYKTFPACGKGCERQKTIKVDYELD